MSFNYLKNTVKSGKSGFAYLLKFNARYWLYFPNKNYAITVEVNRIFL